MIDKEKVRAKEYMKAGEKTLVVLSIQPRLSVLIFFFFGGGGGGGLFVCVLRCCCNLPFKPCPNMLTWALVCLP